MLKDTAHETTETQSTETTEPAVKTSRQSTSVLNEARVLNAEQRAIAVTIIRAGKTKHRWPYVFPPEVLQASMAMWDGKPAFCDHWDKSVKNMCGTYSNVTWDDADQSIKATLTIFDEEIFRVAEHVIGLQATAQPAPDLGISADILCEYIWQSDDSRSVLRITNVISGDVVFQPAAGGSLDRVLNSLGIEAQLEVGDEPAAGPPQDDPPADPTLTKRVRDLQGTADRLRNQVSTLEAAQATTSAQLTAAVEAYRRAILDANPTIPERLIAGATVEEIASSVDLAKSMIDDIRARLAEETAETPVPAGAPGRTPPDLSTLSPREKIKAGLAAR